MSEFRWTSKKTKAVILLSQGFTNAEVAEESGIAERTIYRWKNEPKFTEELDRLSLMTDIAGRAYRLRMAKRVVRQKGFGTEKDLLDWLKYAQGETDGVKLDIASLLDDAEPVAGSGSSRDTTEETEED